MSSNRLAIKPLSVLAPLVALGLIATASAYGQTSALATPRIQSEVNESQLVPLKGNTLRLAQSRSDLGRVPDSTPAHMLMVLRRSDAQQKALDHLVAAQNDPKSASYHKWLTPEQFGAQFGVADADVQTVTAYLASHGFSVGRVYTNKMAIEFSGTTGQVRSAFKTEIHSYSVNGQVFHANASDPQVPLALAPVVHGFAAMNNYRTPMPQSAQPMLRDAKTGKARPLYSDPVNNVVSLSPGDLAVIYDIPTAKYNGAGVTVGIISDSNINVAIPANYRTTFGLPANPPTTILDGVDPGINDDAALAYEQIELVAATAPAAQVNLYTAGNTDLDTGIDFATIRAVQDNAVQVLVFGFESCEANLGALHNQVFSLMWQQAAAQGISVIVGSGSGGAAECDVPPNGTAPATKGLAVNGYASSPFVTAVGATDFFYGPPGSVNPADPGPNFTQYWSQETTSYTSALKYIPEQPSNSSNQSTNQAQFPPILFATGGGASTLGNVDADGNQSPWPRPSYQGSGSARTIPDVSIFGSRADTNGSAYIFCVSPTDCVNGTPGTLQYTADGNSALSAATFGGIAALVVQAKGVQGNLNPSLYATSSMAGAFHDITVGTNEVQCASGSPNCVGGFTSGYTAATGYDEASGLGSVDVANLIADWKTGSASATVAMSLTLPGTSTPITTLAHDGPAQLNVSVTGTSGSPSGDVSITAAVPQQSTRGIEVLTLASGQAVDASIGQVLPGGTYNLVARYAGDGTFAPATTSIPITVTPVASALAMLTTDQRGNPLPVVFNGQTVPYGSSVHFTFQVYNPADLNDPMTPTGSVVLSDNGAQLAILPLDSEGFASFISTALPAGRHSFSATYSGDPTFLASSLTGPAPSVVIGGAKTTTALTATGNNLSSSNGVILLVATVTGTGNGPAPKGSVNFNRADGTLLGTVALGTGSTSSATPYAETAYTVPRGKLQFSNFVTATYVPDASGNYTGSTSPQLKVVFGNTPGLTNTQVAITATPLSAQNFLTTSALNFTATVTGGTTPTGTVTFISSNGATLGTAPLVATPVDPTTSAANITIPASVTATLPLGASQIFAQYNGDATHAGGATYYIVHIYDAGSTPDFALQSDQTYRTINSSNQTATYTLQFTSLNGLSTLGTAINLAYTSPSVFKCKATPTGPSFGGGTYATVSFSCGPNTGFIVGQLVTPSNPHSLWMAEGGAALACIFLFGMPSRRRKWQSMIGTLALIVVAFGVTGCGSNMASMASQTLSLNPGGTATPQSTGVIPPGTYTVIVTGTANVLTRSNPNTTVTVVHNIPLQIVVQ